MQCHEMRYLDLSLLASQCDSKKIKMEKEVIHSGHFMVSHFEAEAQDDEYEVAVPVPEIKYSDAATPQNNDLQVFKVNKTHKTTPSGQLAIETSLTKLFQCMSLAYRQKLTSPKWNRFRGIRLRWKDKIRLNNVIWRCWHMQFIKRENTLVCQFASPLDEGTHNKPEAVVLEGKYWKRKLAAVTAEYKRWRMFYRNKIMGWASKDTSLSDLDMFDWHSQSTDSSHFGPMMVDEDYMELMSDTLFSTITSNQPFAFPDTREIAKGAGLADFIQPSLVQLQPNLDDFMDAFEPFQDVFSSKLPPVPEDCAVSDLSYRTTQSFPDLTLDSHVSTLSPQANVPTVSQPTFQPVIGYTGPLPEEGNSEVKSSSYYHSKVGSSQASFSDNITNPNQTYVCPDTINSTTQSIDSSVVPGAYKFDDNGSENGNKFTGEKIQQSRQSTFKIPSGNSKISFKQYQKISPSTSFVPKQFDRIQQNYDLAVNSQESLLPETPVISRMKNTMRSNSMPVMNKTDAVSVPKHQQNVINLKTRQRTKSGSSVVMVKSKPPPLSTANSDSALNISSALLAQLLTSSNSRVYNLTQTSERVPSSQTIVKSTNVPIMPSPPKEQLQSVLPLPSHPGTLLVANPSSSTMQNYISAVVRPVSSPESISECNTVQNLPSPTSHLIFSGTLSPTSQKQENISKSSSGSNEHRRVCHINAEQKRRYNIKNGFDVLHSLVPYLTLNPNVKLSKATMLQKGAEYIRQLQAERLKMQEDIEGLKYQIDCLSTSISNCQSLLPATGAPISHHRTTKMREMFDDFVRNRTIDNWKFWIFSLLFEPLLQSFNCSVSTASYEDLYRSTLIWVEQHCSLVELRPVVLNSLRNLCTSTEILSNPSKLPEEARSAVNKKKS